jgi:predicted Fe-Mo cluster-binding NifX family protein
MVVAFPTNNQRTITSHIGLSKGFLIIDTDTNQTKYIQNPVVEMIKENNINLKNRAEGKRGLGVGRVVSELLVENGVDIFVAKEFGDGIKRNLNRIGIELFQTDTKEIDNILETITTNESDFAYEINSCRGRGRYKRYQ